MRVERKKKSTTANPTTQNDNHASAPQPSTPQNGSAAQAQAQPQPAHEDGRPVYFISIVAEMVETHPQTLRMYERVGLICPCRTPAGVRLYSQADVEQVRRIQHLTQELGVNLAGVEVIFDLLREMQRLQDEMQTLAEQKSTQAAKTNRP